MSVKTLFTAFFDKWNGKPCEVNDPSNLNQCMDLAYAWLDELKVPRDAIRHLYASEVYTKPNDITLEYFEIRPNTAKFIPIVGDLAVFNNWQTISGVRVNVGHISVCTGKNSDTNAFESFDQNWGTTVNKCGLIRHSYDQVLGFLRFRVEPTPEITEQTILPIIDASGHEMEVQAVRSKLADQERQITNLLTERDELLAKVDQQTIQMTSFINTIKLQEEKITHLQNLPNAALQTILQVHDTLYGSGWWWVKLAKIKTLIPK